MRTTARHLHSMCERTHAGQYKLIAAYLHVSYIQVERGYSVAMRLVAHVVIYLLGSSNRSRTLEAHTHTCTSRRYFLCVSWALSVFIYAATHTCIIRCRVKGNRMHFRTSHARTRVCASMCGTCASRNWVECFVVICV